MKEFLKDLLTALIIVTALSLLIKPVVVSGDSMEPSFKDRDFVLVNKAARLAESYDYGDVVVARSDEIGGLIIKRVIGKEEDRIKIKNGKVYRNGKALKENYTAGPVNKEGSYRVSEDSYFLMGDNRNFSFDSREKAVGSIKKEDIAGRVFIRLFPLTEIRLF